MINYLFFIGIFLIALGLFIRFKFQNNYKIGSDSFKKSRSLSFFFLGSGVVCICFYFILESYNTFPTLKAWSKIFLAGTIYVYVCFVFPYIIQRKINKIYKKKRKFGFGFDTPKEYFTFIYLGITTGVPIVISFLFGVFSIFKIFPEFTLSVGQFIDFILYKSTNEFIFLIYGFLVAPILLTLFYTSIAMIWIFTGLYLIVCMFIWKYVAEKMPNIFKVIYIIFTIAVYYAILDMFLESS